MSWETTTQMTNFPVESLHFEMDPSQPTLRECGMGRPASPVGTGKVPTMPMMGRRDPHLQETQSQDPAGKEKSLEPFSANLGYLCLPHRQLPQLWERKYGHYTCLQHSGASVLTFMLFIGG